MNFTTSRSFKEIHQMRSRTIIAKILLNLGLCIVFMSGSTQSEVLLVNTFGQGTVDPGTDYGFVSPMTSGRAVAQQFQTLPVGGYPDAGFSSYAILSTSLNMYRTSSGTGSVNLSLFSNIQGSTTNNSKDTPGTLVADLGTFTINSIGTTTDSLVTSNVRAETKLNTVYWIVASVAGGTGALAFNTTTKTMTDSISSFSGFIPISSYIYPPSQSSWYIDGLKDSRYNANPIVLSVTVPEPSTYNFGIVSAITLGLLARRHGRTSPPVVATAQANL